MTELERLANDTLEQLCNQYPGDVDHRVTMRAAFEIFAAQIIFREANEQLLKERKHWYKMAYRWE